MIKISIAIVPFFSIAVAFSSIVDAVKFYGKSINELFSKRVMLSDSYFFNQHYSVLCLLYVVGRDYRSWSFLVPSMHNYVKMRKILNLFSDGVLTSWHFDNPTDEKFSLPLRTIVQSYLIPQNELSDNLKIVQCII